MAADIVIIMYSFLNQGFFLSYKYAWASAYPARFRPGQQFPGVTEWHNYSCCYVPKTSEGLIRMLTEEYTSKWLLPAPNKRRWSNNKLQLSLMGSYPVCQRHALSKSFWQTPHCSSPRGLGFMLHTATWSHFEWGKSRCMGQDNHKEGSTSVYNGQHKRC